MIGTHRSGSIACIAALTLALGVGMVVSACASDHHAPSQASHELPEGVPAPSALAMLQEGNRRFVSGAMQHPRQTPARRFELAEGQQPLAVVLGCADSRTSPEVIFDQGLGDLFVDRVAGNVIDDHTLGSIEYAVEHLGARLIVVLGHQRCGAVKAAREAVAAKDQGPAHIRSLIAAIRPAVESTLGQDAEATCRANIVNIAGALRDSEPVLHRLIAESQVTVVGAYYNFDTGVVSFLNLN